MLKLPELNEQTKLLIVCMGTGVVPFIGMLERINNLGSNCKVALIFGVRNDTTMCFYKEFLLKFF